MNETNLYSDAAVAMDLASGDGRVLSGAGSELLRRQGRVMAVLCYARRWSNNHSGREENGGRSTKTRVVALEQRMRFSDYEENRGIRTENNRSGSEIGDRAGRRMVVVQRKQGWWHWNKG
ncbi:hypothetical protein PIB30_030241 [Stylosanthes scabra]|uniref:Uncharacterized protein n=1 Tax=Stylosanthes scabra TaxID=79078 RepID=A0ABU6WCI9_9FABA|nr:hypothetical protein [Stylosanthes scabra]